MELILLMLVRLVLMVIFFRIILQTLVFKSSKETTTFQTVDSVDGNEYSYNESDYKGMDNAVDPVCGRLINKDKAYIILKDGNAHYFCSWECREKYVSNMKRQLKVSEQLM